MLIASLLASVDAENAGSCTEIAEVVAEPGADLAALLRPFVESGRPVVLRGAVRHWVENATTWWSAGAASAESAFTQRFASATVRQSTAVQVAFFDNPVNDKTMRMDAVLEGDEQHELIFATNDPAWEALLPADEWQRLYTAIRRAPSSPKAERRFGRDEREFERVSTIGRVGLGLPFHLHEDSMLGLVLGVKHWLIS
jgi:hypothetical protein